MKKILVILIVALLVFSVSVTTFAQKKPKSVGWVGNYMMHEWYQSVQKGMKERARQLGITLYVADANLDMAKQVALAEDMLTKNIDVLIITPVQQEGAEPIVKKAHEAGIPVIIEASMVKGGDTLVAICDYDAGYKGGVEIGKILKAKKQAAKIMAIDLPMLRPCILRCDGFIDGVKTQISDVTVVHRLDGQGVKDKVFQVASDALTKDPDINVIYGCNDDSALGALQAYKEAKLDTKKLLVCGTGGEGLAFMNAMFEKGPYQVESAMFPEAVGFGCIDTSVKVFNKEKVPEHVVTPTFGLTMANLRDRKSVV